MGGVRACRQRKCLSALNHAWNIFNIAWAQHIHLDTDAKFMLHRNCLLDLPVLHFNCLHCNCWLDCCTRCTSM